MLFNTFQTVEIEGVANIIKALKGSRRITCTLPKARVDGFFRFRVWLGTPRQLSFKMNGNPSTGSSNATRLVEIVGDDMERVQQVCGCFVEDLGRKERNTGTMAEVFVWF